MDCEKLLERKIKDNFKLIIYCKLPIIEVILYYIVWISGMLYLLYNVYLTSIEYTDNNKITTNGWSYIGLKRDAYENVFELLYDAVYYIIFYGLVHFIIADVLKCFYKQALPYYYFTYTMAIITFHISYKIGIALVVQFLLSTAIIYCGDRFYIWFYGLATITTVYFPLYNLSHLCDIKNAKLISLLQSTLLWNSLRYLAFALHIKQENHKQVTYNDFINFLGYYFYFPTMCHGPLILYEDFQQVYEKQYTANFLQRLSQLLTSIIECIGILYLVILLLHYLHYGLLFQLEEIRISYPAFHGLYWWAGFLFMSKHLVAYGMATSAAKAEGISVPNTPKCIGCITLYSEMWKTFDQSMYWFKRKYIFKAFVGNSNSKVNQAIASLLCFFFVIIWHGCHPKIIIWTAINYIEVVLEKAGSKLLKANCFLSLYKVYLHPSNIRRMTALLSVPLFCASSISQYFLFGTYASVQRLIMKIKQESYFINGLILLVVYCGCQVSMAIKRRGLVQQVQIEQRIHKD